MDALPDFLRPPYTFLFLLAGLACIGWAGYSVFTGKGYYRGCPPGGYDRTSDPLGFWPYTLIILAIGISLVLNSLGVISLPDGGRLDRDRLLGALVVVCFFLAVRALGLFEK
jgi:hypothetical protein